MGFQGPLPRNVCSFTIGFTKRRRFVSLASDDHFEWGSKTPFREACAPLLHVLLQGDDLSPWQATTTLNRVPGPPSAKHVFLYCKFYYKATICLLGKPRPLEWGSRTPFREACVPRLRVLLQSITARPRFVSLASDDHFEWGSNIPFLKHVFLY